MLLSLLRSSGSAMSKCSTSGAATDGALEFRCVDACELRASASIRLARIASRAACASCALSSMISTCVRDAELVEEDGTFKTSSAELSTSTTGTAGTVDGSDDSTVTAADDAGAVGDVVTVLGGVVAIVGVDAVDVRSIIASYTADNLRLTRRGSAVRVSVDVQDLAIHVVDLYTQKVNHTYSMIK